MPSAASLKDRIGSHALPLAGIVFMVIYLLDVEYVSTIRGLDLSWHTLLGYAYEHRLQHGTEVIFNYGPLSFIESAVYFEDSHADKLFYRSLFLLILGWGAVYVLKIASVGRLLAWCGLTMLLLMLRDVYLLLPALLLVHLECRRQRGNFWQLALSLALAFAAAFACLVKSNAVFFTVPALLLASLYRFSIRDPWPVVPVAFALSLVVLFGVSGQSVSNLPTFLVGYWDVSRAHNEDMGLAAPWPLKLAFLLGAAAVVSTLRFHDRQGRALGMLTLGYLLVAYKMGFIRHGEHPQAAFLALAFIGVVQLWSAGGHFRSHHHRRIVALVAMGAAGFVASSALLASLLPHGKPLKGYAQVLQNRFRYVLQPSFRAQADAEARRRHDEAVAQARAALPPGELQSPIDVFPFEFSLAYASGLPIAQRPAFQSYFATSRHMTERNARFLFTEQAPRTVLFSVAPIDGRYPAQEDPLAIGSYRQLYQLDRTWAEGLVLARRATPAVASRSCQQVNAAFGQILTLPATRPDQAVWAEVAMAPTALGKLLGLLVGPPVVQMKVDTAAGSQHYRALREAGEVGFLLSPALVSNEAAARFFQGSSIPQDGVRSFSIQRPGSVLPWFGQSLAVKLCVLSWHAGP